MNEASRIALNVDTAPCGAREFLCTLYRIPSGSVPMDIGNVAKHTRTFHGSYNRCQKESCRLFIWNQDKNNGTKCQYFKTGSCFGKRVGPPKLSKSSMVEPKLVR